MTEMITIVAVGIGLAGLITVRVKYPMKMFRSISGLSSDFDIRK